jgi:predicted dehydrogenase
MEYKLGVIGIGHWFRRLYSGIASVGSIEITKALGTRPYESKAEMLSGFGIDRSMYFTVRPDGSIPDEFFEGVDAVHISNPNSFHARQIKETLSKGKKAVVEKTFAVTKKEFDDVVEYIKKGGYQDSVYLHLHYLHKLPTTELANSIEGLVSKHGKIESVCVTVLEQHDDEDARRAGWLFRMDNGGLFMDWIHVFEILYYAARPSFGKIENLELYEVDSSYDTGNPTGIFAELGLSGRLFGDGARLAASIAKGTEEKYAKKGMLLKFESGAYARLSYMGSEKESRDRRGSFEIGRMENGKRVAELTKPLSGDSSSEIFVREIVELCGGINIGLSINQIGDIFAPQWDYQSIYKGKQIINERKRVEEFLERAANEV